MIQFWNIYNDLVLVLLKRFLFLIFQYFNKINGQIIFQGKFGKIFKWIYDYVNIIILRMKLSLAWVL